MQTGFASFGRSSNLRKQQLSRQPSPKSLNRQQLVHASTSQEQDPNEEEVEEEEEEGDGDEEEVEIIDITNDGKDDEPETGSETVLLANQYYSYLTIEDADPLDPFLQKPSPPKQNQWVVPTSNNKSRNVVASTSSGLPADGKVGHFSITTSHNSITGYNPYVYHRKHRLKLLPNCRCDICGKGFLRFSSLRDHKKLHTGSTRCILCGKTLSTVANLKHHYITVHQKSYTEARVLSKGDLTTLL